MMREYLRLKRANCKNCYKCIRRCPVKAISFSGNQAHILPDECILCGQCFVVCPQNAKEIAGDLDRAKALITGEAPVIASIAPSFIANYDGIGIRGMENALKQLGFFAAEETARGATVVKREYERMLAEGKDIVISSCCPSVNLLIRKYYPGVLPYLADVVSPMLAHCRDIKERYPQAKTVFIGPCVSKKAEAEEHPEDVDCVLTFEELSRWLAETGITPKAEQEETAEGRTRLFPVSGGIIKSMDCNAEGYTYLSFDGTRRCIAALQELEKGGLSHCFIEMSACDSGCIGGPVMEKYHNTPVFDFEQVIKYAGKSDFTVAQPPREKTACSRSFIGTSQVLPSQAEIDEILAKMGKSLPEYELNCGSCGYNTCREKAVAVYQGKADLTMCLPFLKEKAESFSNNIVNHSPNGIIVLNDNLEIQIINDAARTILNQDNAALLRGEPVVTLLNPTEFIEVRNTHAGIRDKRVELPEYGRTVEMSIVYDSDFHVLIGMMHDVTEVEQQRRQREGLCRNTVETTDKVIEKQMRVVQEIASLLGETAAETKIALTRLKESVIDE